MKRNSLKLLFTCLVALFISSTPFCHQADCDFTHTIDSESNSDILPEIEEID